MPDSKNYVWTGNRSASWKDPQNWYNDTDKTVAKVIPGTDDSVTFDTTRLTGQKNINSTVDANFVLKNFTISDNYQAGTISLAQDLRAAKNFTQKTGTIQGPGKLTIAESGSWEAVR
jgi:hypothetical protein